MLTKREAGIHPATSPFQSHTHAVHSHTPLHDSKSNQPGNIANINLGVLWVLFNTHLHTLKCSVILQQSKLLRTSTNMWHSKLRISAGPKNTKKSQQNNLCEITVACCWSASKVTRQLLNQHQQICLLPPSSLPVPPSSPAILTRVTSRPENCNICLVGS